MRDNRAAVLDDLARLESQAGYRLIPTPAEDPTIPLVCLAPPNRIVAQFNKLELAMVLGHDSAKCSECRGPQLVIAR